MFRKASNGGLRCPKSDRRGAFRVRLKSPFLPQKARQKWGTRKSKALRLQHCLQVFGVEGAGQGVFAIQFLLENELAE